MNTSLAEIIAASVTADPQRFREAIDRSVENFARWTIETHNKSTAYIASDCANILRPYAEALSGAPDVRTFLNLLLADENTMSARILLANIAGRLQGISFTALSDLAEQEKASHRRAA